jgi:transposase
MAGPGCPPSGLDPTRTEESLATRPGYIAGPNYLLAALDGAQLAAFKAFADGVRLWRSELLAYFDEPTTDVYAEGVINKVKVIKRRVYGLPTFEGLRERDSQHAADGTTRRPPLDDENPVFGRP